MFSTKIVKIKKNYQLFGCVMIVKLFLNALNKKLLTVKPKFNKIKKVYKNNKREGALDQIKKDHNFKKALIHIIINHKIFKISKVQIHIHLKMNNTII